MGAVAARKALVGSKLKNSLANLTTEAASGAKTFGQKLVAKVNASPFGNEIGAVGSKIATSDKLVRKTLPKLPSSFEAAFDGPVRLRTFKKGERLYRSPNTKNGALESVDDPGPWFGTRKTKTKNGTESQYYIKSWGNPLEKVRVYEFNQDVTFHYGKVKNGKGYQALSPIDVDQGSVLKHIDEWSLK